MMTYDNIIKRGLNLGIEEIELYVVESEGMNMSLTDGLLDTNNFTNNFGMSIRGLYQGKMGYVYLESLDEENVEFALNSLIENGILKSYLVDKRNSKKMNHPITGSSRRESYKHMTTSRMTNTYFLNGTSTFEEIIANTKYGLFAKRMGGGSVNPATGEFNFAVNEGYMIEDGKITKPVRGATLVGSGKDVLMRIDMIANNLSHGHGMCGSMSGSIPTNVGQPTIRVSKMTVGGKGSK